MAISNHCKKNYAKRIVYSRVMFFSGSKSKNGLWKYLCWSDCQLIYLPIYTVRVCNKGARQLFFKNPVKSGSLYNRILYFPYRLFVISLNSMIWPYHSYQSRQQLTLRNKQKQIQVALGSSLFKLAIRVAQQCHTLFPTGTLKPECNNPYLNEWHKSLQ